jgi:hypothetical protein
MNLSPAIAVEAVAKHGGIKQAARALGVAPQTMRKHYRRAVPGPRLVFPEFPDETPIAEILEARRRAFIEAQRYRDLDTWAAIEVRDPQPIGVLWFGDPHIDDDGCNVDLLYRHAELCRTVPGLYGANIGDTTNNWVGRLARLYANQEASKRTARRLARWFLTEAGINWILWLMGNHDEWGDGAEVLRLMSGDKVYMRDWEARFRLVFPSGRQIRIHAAHDFPGSSQWNIGHGPGKAARMSSDADLFVCGHRHDWTVQQFELAGLGRVPTIIRARGYKWHDDFATRHGYQQSQSGAAVLTIFNPSAEDPAGRVIPFADVETGVEVLKAVRGAAAARQKPLGRARKPAARRPSSDTGKGRKPSRRRRKAA